MSKEDRNFNTLLKWRRDQWAEWNDEGSEKRRRYPTKEKWVYHLDTMARKTMARKTREYQDKMLRDLRAADEELRAASDPDETPLWMWCAITAGAVCSVGAAAHFANKYRPWKYLWTKC